MSGNMSKNSSQNSSDISQYQAPYLQDMWGQAQDWVGQNDDTWNHLLKGLNPGIKDMTNDAKAQYDQNMQGVSDAFDQQLGGGIYGQAYGQNGIANVLADSMINSLNNPNDEQSINAMIMGGSGNNYADAMKNEYMQDANRAQEQMLANTDARAAASGMSGGSRHGIQQGMGMENINENLQSNLARTGFETFDKDLDRKLGIAQRADAGTMQRQNMMRGMMGEQNAAQMNAINNLGMMNQQAQGGMDINDRYNRETQNTYLQRQQPLTWLNSMIGGPVMSSQGSSKGISMGGGVK